MAFQKFKKNHAPDTNGAKKTGAVLMTEGCIWKQILFFSVPLILGNLLQQMYNAADSIIVGNCVGSNALAAVGSSTSLINLLISFSMGASVGAGVIVSQYLGARDDENVGHSVHTSLAIALILGLVLTVAGIALSPQLLRWMGTPDEVMPDSTLYLRVYSFGIVFNVLYNMAAGILNAVGNSRRSLMYLACAATINIVLDLVLIAGMGMGVEGAAIATDMSQVLSSILALAYLMRTPENYRVDLRKIRIHKRSAVKIIRVGLPAGIQNTVISFSNVLVQSSVNAYGAMAMAGFGAYLKIDGFNILPVLSFSMAATTFVGQNYGAGRMDRVKKSLWVTMGMGFFYTIATGVLLLTFRNQAIGLFSQDPEVIAYGTRAMWYFCPFYWLLSIMHSQAGTIRGTGRTIPPMVVLLIALCLFRIIWIQFVVPAIGTIDGVYALYPASWLLGMILMTGYTWKGHWREHN